VGGTCRKTKQIVAIKLIKNMFENEYSTTKVLREIQILKHLSHMPNNFYTVKLLDLVVSPDKTGSDMSLFIVMDNVQSDLKSTMEQFDQVGITREHVNKIVYNCLCAIKFIHSANVIHRDIKPSNILIDPDCCIKICDFGLARTLPESCIG
jgi:serine/threonine protein kinase